ncbi:hypothetical protein D3C72_1997580 [compost metagenome]
MAIVDSEQVNDVLKDHPARLSFFEDAYDFPEQAATFTAQTAAVSVVLSGSGNADVLAGETRGDDVDGGQIVGTALAHVFKLACMGKSIGKHSPVDRVEFNLPGAAVTGIFKSDIKTSYACEQASNGGLLHS